jgi:hypothetical protein
VERKGWNERVSNNAKEGKVASKQEDEKLKKRDSQAEDWHVQVVHVGTAHVLLGFFDGDHIYFTSTLLRPLSLAVKSTFATMAFHVQNLFPMTDRNS